ncbi:MFS transporter [Pseudonocardia sp.]|uniref:MFS transporter n=1 Tax=Pseudonocardia sp. TaxID=60912 RepID=UPI003D0A3A7F
MSPARARLPWRVHLLATGAFAVGTSAYVVSGVLPLVSEDLGVSVAAAGQLTTVFALAYALGAPLLAVLTGRWERRTLLVAALATATVGNLVCALAPNYPLLLGGRVVAALGAAVLTPGATAVATQLAAPAQRGRAVAAVFGGITLSLVVGVPLGSLLGGPLGYRGVFALIAGLCLAGAVAVRLLMPVVAAPQAAGLRERIAVAADTRVLAVLTITVLALTAMMSVYSYAAPLFEASAGVRREALGLLLLAYGVGALAGNALGGRLADRYGSKRPMVASMASFTVLLGLLPFAISTAIGAAVALFLLGAAGWTTNAPVQSRLIALAPDGASLLLALNASAVYLGVGLAGLIGGAVVATLGVAPLAPVAAGIALLALLLVPYAMRGEPAVASRP